MQFCRPVFALHPLRFGRGPARLVEGPSDETLSSDLRLFAATFIAGFVFVSILIG